MPMTITGTYSPAMEERLLRMWRIDLIPLPGIASRPPLSTMVMETCQEDRRSDDYHLRKPILREVQRG